MVLYLAPLLSEMEVNLWVYVYHMSQTACYVWEGGWGSCFLYFMPTLLYK